MQLLRQACATKTTPPPPRHTSNSPCRIVRSSPSRLLDSSTQTDPQRRSSSSASPSVTERDKHDDPSSNHRYWDDIVSLMVPWPQVVERTPCEHYNYPCIIQIAERNVCKSFFYILERVRALNCEAEGRSFESHSGQWLDNSLCSLSS